MIVKRADYLVAFNDEIARAAEQVDRSIQVVQGQSFVPERTMVDLVADRHRSQASSPCSRVIVTSGYRTPVYRHLEVLDAFRQVKESLSYPIKLHIYSYGGTDTTYWSSVQDAIGDDGSVNCFNDLDVGEFLRGLAASDVYVRNTAHDSYGVAVEEALFLGVPAIATSVVARPKGTIEYPLGDTAALRQAIRTALDLGDVSRPTTNGYHAYREVMRMMSLSRASAKRRLASDIWLLNRSARAFRNRLLTVYWRTMCHRIGPQTIICHPFQLTEPASVSIGRRVFIGSGASMSARGGLTIEDDVLAGPNLVISGGNHSLEPTERRVSKDELNPPLHIGKNVWIGANVTILAGASIGENSVVGAGSVVTKPLPSNSICVGVPCRVVRDLDGTRTSASVDGLTQSGSLSRSHGG